MLSPERLERLRQALLEERTRLRQDLEHMSAEDSELATDATTGVGNHMADDATEMYNQEAMVSLIRSQEQILDEVESALERMDDGNYGQCERCGQEIDYARLKARPYARYCMSCQRLIESER